MITSQLILYSVVLDAFSTYVQLAVSLSGYNASVVKGASLSRCKSLHNITTTKKKVAITEEVEIGLFGRQLTCSWGDTGQI